MIATPLTAPELSCLLAVRGFNLKGEGASHGKIAASLGFKSRRSSGRLIESLTRKGFLARNLRGLLVETVRAL